MILAIDAMGSDKGPSVFIEPVKRFVRDYDAEIRVYGDKEALAALEGIEHVTVVPTTEVMEMDDGPLAVRRKKDSSMVRAVTDLKEGLADGVVSAGSTGALLSAGSLLVKTAEPVERAGILCMIPTKTGEPFATAAIVFRMFSFLRFAVSTTLMMVQYIWTPVSFLNPPDIFCRFLHLRRSLSLMLLQ